MPQNVHEHLEISLYVVETAPYQSLHLVDREYPHWILSYIACGDIETSSRGETWRARSGDIMIHPPHLPFSEIASGPGTHKWLSLDVSVAHNIDLFRLYPVAPVVPLPSLLNFSAVFDTLAHLWHEPSAPFRALQLSALAFQLCGIVLEGWSRTGYIPRPAALLTPQDRFIDVIRYMNEHLEQKLSRDDLAALVHLHPGYFDRIFHQIHGVAPMGMLRDLRLRRALQLLETTDMPLSALALKCGLGDAGYFSRVFRQCYGQTPGQYRQGVKSAMTSYIPPL